MDHFAAISGATADELAQVSEMAMEMGRTTVFSANEAAGAMVELGKAGFTTKEILGGIGEAVVALAAAADMPLVEATEVLANTMRTFNLEAKDAVYIADQLAGAANASTIEVKDLAVSLRYTGGVASALGIPLHEVADALAILGNNGIRGSTAGTTLRRILLELNPATKRQTEALMELGIIQENANVSTEQLAAAQEKFVTAQNAVSKAQERVNQLTKEYEAAGAPATAQEAAKRAQELAAANEDLADKQDLANRAAEAHKGALKGQSNEFFHANGQAKSLGEIFQIVEDRTKHLNSAEKQRYLDIIFGSRAIAGAIILAREGAAGFAEISAQIEKVSAAEVAAQRLDNLAGSLRRLKNILLTELVEAATPLLGTLQRIVERVTELVTSFGNLPEGVRTATLVLLGVFGAAAILGGGLLLLVSFIAKAVRAFFELKNIMVGTNVAKHALEKNVGVFSGVLSKLGVVVRLLLSPFKLLWSLFVSMITAVAAFLGVSVATVAIVLVLIALFVLLLVKCKPVRDFFINLGQTIWEFVQKIPGYFMGLVDTVVGFFSRLVTTIDNAFLAVGRFFMSLPGIIGGALATALSFVANFVMRLIQFWFSLPGRAIEAFTMLLGIVVNFLAQLPERLAYATGFMIGLWIRMWLTFFEKVTEFTALIVAGIIGFFVMLFNTAVEWGPKIFFAIVDFFEQLPGRIVGFLDMVWENFTAWADRMWDRAWQFGSDVLAAITEWFQQLPGRIGDFLYDASINISNWAEEQWNRFWQFGSDVLSAIVEWFSQLPGRIAEFLGNIAQDISTWVSNSVSEARRMGTDFFNGVINGIQGLPGAIGGVLERVIQAFLGLIRRGYEAAKNLAGALWDGFKAGLGISSPSYIERAMWDMTDNVQDSIKDLKSQIGTIQKLALEIATPESANFNNPAAWAALENQIRAIVSQAGQIGQQAQNVFNNEFHTNADPEQISAQIMWDQLVRVR